MAGKNRSAAACGDMFCCSSVCWCPARSADRGKRITRCRLSECRAPQRLALVVDLVNNMNANYVRKIRAELYSRAVSVVKANAVGERHGLGVVSLVDNVFTFSVGSTHVRRVLVRS